jgi:threonine/homoserine/homoserine lactone efflux protein
MDRWNNQTTMGFRSRSGDHDVVIGLVGSLLVFAVITICSPGANNLLAATSGARFGLRASAGLIAGLALAVVTLIAVAAAGVGAVVTSRPGLQLVLRAAGTAYLLWLAVHVARSGRPALEDGPESPPGFRTGVLVTSVNPKTWTVALSAASGYSAISADPLVLAAVLAGVFTVVVVPNLVLWCVGGEVLARRLSTDHQWAVLNGTLAALLALSVIPMWLE